MTSKEIVESFFHSLQVGDFIEARQFLADDFQYYGRLPRSLDVDVWLELSARLKAACPNLDYHFRIVSAGEQVVRDVHYLSGIHSEDLDLTPLGLGVISPSGLAFSLPRESAEATLQDGKIVAYQVYPAKDAGLKALFEKFGVVLPVS